MTAAALSCRGSAWYFWDCFWACSFSYCRPNDHSYPVKVVKPKSELFGGYIFKCADNLLLFKQFLDERFDDYKIVVYIREPISLYCSQIQSWIKRGRIKLDSIPRPKEFNAGNRAAIEQYVDIFGVSAISANKFSKDYLYHEDIIKDFEKKYLPSQINLKSIRPNRAIPGGVLVFMHLLQEEWPRMENGYLSDPWQELRTALRRSSFKEDLPLLEIKDPNILATIMHNNNGDSNWINQTFFDGHKVFSCCSSSKNTLEDVSTMTDTSLKEILSEYLTPEALYSITKALLKYHNQTKS